MTCEETRELIDLYALGALDDAESRQVADHLAVCAECRAALEQAEEATAHLPLALATASPVTLPPDLKARVLASATQAERTAPIRDISQAASSSAPVRKSFTVPLWINRRSAAIAAGVLILIAALGWGVRLSQALDRERSIRESLTALASQQQEIVIEVLDAPDGEKLFLAPTADDSDAYGKVFIRPDMADVVIMANRLPPPPDGQAYHVWLTVDGRDVLAGTLPLSDQGFGMLIHKAPQPGPTYDAVQITLQDAEATERGSEVVLRWPSE